MTKAQKYASWLLGVPIMSAVHYFAAMALIGALLVWRHSAEPPSLWVIKPLETLLVIMVPVMYIVLFFDCYIFRLSDIWYSPVSFIVSSLLWWSLIAWLITQRPIRKWKERKAANKTSAGVAGTPQPQG